MYKQLMTLVDGCTAEMLYKQLEELGVNIFELRKINPDMARLEEMYYQHLNDKLSNGANDES